MFEIQVKQNLSRVWVSLRHSQEVTDKDLIQAATDYGKASGFNPSTVQVRILDKSGTVLKTHCEAQKCHRF